MTLAFSLYLVLCSSIGGCTEVPHAKDLTHIQCLMAGATAVDKGRADKFVCRREDTPRA